MVEALGCRAVHLQCLLLLTQHRQQCHLVRGGLVCAAASRGADGCVC